MGRVVGKIWKRLVRSIWKPDMVTGVAVQVAAPASLEIHACRLSVFKDKLEVSDKHTGLKNALHFSKQYPPGPLALSLAGKGVLTRRIEQPGPTAAVLQKILPNASAEEFYMQFHQDDEGHYVSLVRRAEADQLLAEFESYGFKVVSLNLGGFVTENIVRPEAIDEGLLSAYDVAFQSLLLSPGAVEVEAEALVHARQQAAAREKVMRTIRLTGLAVLLLLLLNIGLYQYYDKETKLLAAKNKISGDAAGRSRAAEASIFKKSKLVKSVGWLAGLNPAFLTDRLLSLIPAGIVVRKFSLNPADNAGTRSGQQAVYQLGIIEVSGSSSGAAMLNNWLLAVKSFPWVKECRIKDYQVSPESGLGVFTVHIQLKGDEE